MALFSGSIALGQSSEVFNIEDDNNQSLFYVKSNGNVGINIANPRAILQINNPTPFNKSSTINNQDDIFLKDLGGTAGIGSYGSSIGFSRIGHSSVTDRRASIAAYQNTTDEDNIGLSFFVHGDALADDLVEKFRITIDGIFSSGSLTYSLSDGELKQDIQPIYSPLEKVLALNGVTYKWKKEEFANLGLPSDQQLGFVAQNVEEVLPELVHTNSSGYKSVSYSNITAVLVEAVKEQQDEIEILEGELNELKARLDKLESILTQKNK